MSHNSLIELAFRQTVACAGQRAGAPPPGELKILYMTVCDTYIAFPLPHGDFQ